MLGLNKDTLKSGFLTTIALGALRGIVNGALKDVSPKDLVKAINDGTSLWGIAGDDIKGYTKSFPISDFSIISDVKTVVDNQFGGFSTVVINYLAEDHPILHNIIVNTPEGKGKVWLEKQISEILDGVQNGG
jgi:hypothetical protein